MSWRARQNEIRDRVRPDRNYTIAELSRFGFSRSQLHAWLKDKLLHRLDGCGGLIRGESVIRLMDKKLGVR